MAKSKSESKGKSELIYVIAGKEQSLVDAECEKLLEQLLEPGQRATGLLKADPEEVSAGEVLDELRTLPFLTSKRVVIIKGADDFISKNRELLEKYFDNPCPTGILVMTVSGWPPQTKLAKKLPSVGKLLNAAQPARWQLPRRIMNYAKEAHGKNITEAVAELLVELTGDELVRLYGEVDKLAIFAHNEKSITEQHVESLIGHNRIFNAFAVIDAIMAGDIAQATRRLRIMFAEDKTAEYTVIGAFAYHFRRMFNAKVMLEKGDSAAEISKGLNLWGDRAKSFFAQLRRMSLRQIGDILQQLAATDYAIKTGQAKAEAATEQLVLRLAD
ncbi:MAG: DNA polymerase III subunit delta [Sedimentisphaerales bacterium]|nr:DNA polymerase III subunit delta [Sedimentisphaerales bacterium]